MEVGAGIDMEDEALIDMEVGTEIKTGGGDWIDTDGWWG